MAADVLLRRVFPYWTDILETVESALGRIDSNTMRFRVSKQSRSISEIAEHMVEIFDRDIMQFVLARKVERADLGSIDGLLEAVRAQRGVIAVLLDSETISFLEKKSEFMGHERTYGDALWNVFLEQVHHRGQLFLSMGAAGVRPPEV